LRLEIEERGEHTGICGFGDLLLAIAEDEELESVGEVRRAVKHVVLSVDSAVRGVFFELSIERRHYVVEGNV
jgi:hypothetical protein